jgi:SnoaL-like domain
MSNENADLIRRAYQAYASGNLAAMLELVDPDLEWTYLDPTLEQPLPQVCHGHHELEQLLRGWAEHGLRAELEEVAGGGELIMAGVRVPGVDAHHGWRRAIALTASSRSARGGWLLCATAATGRRPLISPASGSAAALQHPAPPATEGHTSAGP